MSRILIYALYNKSEKTAEFAATHNSADSIPELLGPVVADQFDWLRKFKDKNGNFPSKYVGGEVDWDELQYLKELSLATQSGYDHTIRLWTGRSYMDVHWSSDSPYEFYGNYRIRLTGPLHWKSLDMLWEVIYRYLRGRKAIGDKWDDIHELHLIRYMDCYKVMPTMEEVEYALWNLKLNFKFTYDFNDAGIITLHYVTGNRLIASIIVEPRKLQIRVCDSKDPFDSMEYLEPTITYKRGWEESLRTAFLKAIQDH